MCILSYKTYHLFIAKGVLAFLVLLELGMLVYRVYIRSSKFKHLIIQVNLCVYFKQFNVLFAFFVPLINREIHSGQHSNKLNKIPEAVSHIIHIYIHVVIYFYIVSTYVYLI